MLEPRLMLANLLALLLLMAPPGHGDQRQPWMASSPLWLRAVGMLEVPGYRISEGERLHNRETCTATLVAADRVLTAWHCLEHYRDLTHPILFKLPGSSEPPRQARRLIDGDGMSRDWALLALDRPVPGSTATPLPLQSREAALHSVSVAGYSALNGGELSWQSHCTVLGRTERGIETNCRAARGDSGGPAVSDGQLVGVISTGSGSDLTFLVPAGAFLPRLRGYLD